MMCLFDNRLWMGKIERIAILDTIIEGKVILQVHWSLFGCVISSFSSISSISIPIVSAHFTILMLEQSFSICN
jgi:hypothetical protein